MPLIGGFRPELGGYVLKCTATETVVVPQMFKNERPLVWTIVPQNLDSNGSLQLQAQPANIANLTQAERDELGGFSWADGDRVGLPFEHPDGTVKAAGTAITADGRYRVVADRLDLVLAYTHTAGTVFFFLLPSEV